MRRRFRLFSLNKTTALRNFGLIALIGATFPRKLPPFTLIDPVANANALRSR